MSTESPFSEFGKSQVDGGITSIEQDRSGLRANAHQSRRSVSTLHHPSDHPVKLYRKSSRVSELLFFPTSLIALIIVSSMPSRVTWTATQNPEKPITQSIVFSPRTDGSINVEVGLTITNLVEVDEAHEQFRLTGLIVALWNDSRLAFTPRTNERTRFYDQDQIWTPGFELVNAITPLSGTATISASPSGHVYYVERFVATLSTKLQLPSTPRISKS
jgi:hypothetical protein